MDPHTLRLLLMQHAVQHLALGGQALPPSVNYRPGQSPAAPPPPNLAQQGFQRLTGNGGGQAAPAPAPGAPGIAASQTFDAAHPQSTFQAQVPLSNQQFNAGQFSGSVGGAQQSLTGLEGMLQQQANGGGPNLAAQQERQATDRNVSQAFALAQGHPNDAGGARNAVNAAAAANQQAAADSATQRMQQMLAAQQQLGQVSLGQLGTAGSLMTDQQKLALEQSQGNQNAALHAQDTNAGVTSGNQAANLQLLNTGINAAGGFLNGVGGAVGNLITPTVKTPSPGAQTAASPGDTGAVTPAAPIPDTSGAGDYDGGMDTAVTAAHGGRIPDLLAQHFASGGSVPNSYEMASQVADPRMQNLLGNGAPPSLLATAPTARAAGGDPTAPGAGEDPNALAGRKVMKSVIGAVPVVGGLVNGVDDLMYSLHENDPAVKDDKLVAAGKMTPEEYQQKYPDRLTGKRTPDSVSRWADNAIADTGSAIGGAAKGVGDWVGNLFHADGGPIPGKAQTTGDSASNDTVPAMLSPGEVVLPRSVTESDDAPDKAEEFMKAVQASKAPKPTFKDILAGQRSMHQRLSKLELLAKGPPA